MLPVGAAHHSAMRHVGPVRVELGTRTIFNLTGAAVQSGGRDAPAGGRLRPDWMEPLAEVLGRLGAERAWVVHGSDGLDELTTTGPSHVAELKDGGVRGFEVTPEDAGLPLAKLDDLQGRRCRDQCRRAAALLGGEPAPIATSCCSTAAAALVVADKVDRPARGVELAASAIDSGRAQARWTGWSPSPTGRRRMSDVLRGSAPTSATHVAARKAALTWRDGGRRPRQASPPRGFADRLARRVAGRSA